MVVQLPQWSLLHVLVYYILAHMRYVIWPFHVQYTSVLDALMLWFIIQSIDFKSTNAAIYKCAWIVNTIILWRLGWVLCFRSICTMWGRYKTTFGAMWKRVVSTISNSVKCVSQWHHTLFYLTISPLQVVKTRMQVQGAGNTNFKYTSFSHAVMTIGNTDGVRGFYRGFAPTMFREIPFSAIQFAVYGMVLVNARNLVV